MIKKEAEKNIKYKDLTTEIQSIRNVKNKSDISDNRGNWDLLKITQEIPEQHNWPARQTETTANSHTGTARVLREVLM